MISDRGRVTVFNPHWTSAASIMEAAAQSFRMDMWRDQPYHVEVMVEKQALEGILKPMCSTLDIPFTANKGYSSSSALYETGKRLAGLVSEGRKVVVIYLGDHDPSGVDMTRDVEERLRQFMYLGEFDEDLEVIRIALNMDQVRQYAPPPNPTKVSDTRSDAYIRRFGMTCWELDALEPATLADLVRNTVLQYRDEDIYERNYNRQEAQRKQIRDFIDGFEIRTPRKRNKKPETKSYTVGFLINGTSVVLIRKNRPLWQMGKLNGPGGKVEHGETPLQCIRREFREEAGRDIEEWKLFCVLSGKEVYDSEASDLFRVYFFVLKWIDAESIRSGV